MATARQVRKGFVADIIEDIAQARRKLAFVRKHGGAVAKIVAKLQRAGFGVWAYPVGDSHFTVTATVNDLDGFNGGALLKSLAKIEAATGIEFTGSNDFPDLSLREFTGKSEDGVIKLDCNAYLKDGAAHCKRVQIGVEKREVPQYKFVCE